jgi:hypothetical protein
MFEHPLFPHAMLPQIIWAMGLEEHRGTCKNPCAVSNLFWMSRPLHSSQMKWLFVCRHDGLGYFGFSNLGRLHAKVSSGDSCTRTHTHRKSANPRLWGTCACSDGNVAKSSCWTCSCPASVHEVRMWDGLKWCEMCLTLSQSDSLLQLFPAFRTSKVRHTFLLSDYQHLVSSQKQRVLWNMASTRDHAKANPTACMEAPSRIASTSPSNSEATSGHGQSWEA